MKEYFDGENRHRQGPYQILIHQSKISDIRKGCDKSTQKDLLPFLMPPLVDAHVHAGFMALDFSKNLKADLSFNFSRNLKEQKRLSLSYLVDMRNKGFLFLRDLGGHYLARVTLSQIYKDHSDSLPFLESVHRAYSWGRGQCLEGYPCEQAFINIKELNRKEVLTLMKEDKAKGYKNVKIYRDNNPVPGEGMPDDWVSFFLKETRELNLNLAIHLIEPYQFKEPLGDHVSLEHIHDGNSLGSNTRKAQLLPTPISLNLIPYIRERGFEAKSYYFDRLEVNKTISTLIKKGRKLCFGSDFYTVTGDPVRSFGFWSLDHLIEFHRLRMKTKDVLMMAGLNCRSLFKENGPSKIEVGNKANLLFLKGSPFQDIMDLHNIHSLYKEGVKLKN